MSEATTVILPPPSPSQTDALWLLGLADTAPPDQKPVNELVLDGPRGAGKSWLLRAIAIRLADTRPGSAVAIVMRGPWALPAKYPDPVMDKSLQHLHDWFELYTLLPPVQRTVTASYRNTEPIIVE